MNEIYTIRDIGQDWVALNKIVGGQVVAVFYVKKKLQQKAFV